MAVEILMAVGMLTAVLIQMVKTSLILTITILGSIFILFLVILNIKNYLSRRKKREIIKVEKEQEQRIYKKKSLDNFIKRLSINIQTKYFNEIKKQINYLEKVNFHVEIVHGSQELLEDFAMSANTLNNISKETIKNFDDQLTMFSNLLNKEINSYKEQCNKNSNNNQIFLNTKNKKNIDTFNEITNNVDNYNN